ncbi:MerR family transcriptional regulator [Actinomadura logoneensis]|uniref:MerR family transcriptional regulator n=1 Tax=Actinomadura logoneensis TaxID=2293572 RepID=A0A372JHM7_9ACTN|nr:MerR family transcriptional regulator [Actinomadura logoneensis]RFU39525.1 MerR family transcriptional regulator [Actinomadura logoneensis]
MSGGYEGLRSSQVAEAAGVNPQTLRYYERRGLIAEPARTLGGHRLYPADTVTVLRGIKAAQRLGFTLEEVSELLDAVRPGGGRAGGGFQERARLKLAEVERRIIDLQAIRTALLTAVSAGCDDVSSCAAEASCPFPVSDLGGAITEGGG